MKIDYDSNSHSQNNIQFYDENSILVQDKKISAPCIISPEQIIDDWRVESIDALSSKDFECILKLNPEIIILGTGHQIVFPKAELIACIQSQNFGLECMDTGAAIRSFNVLLSEQRNVCAALFMAGM